jgi:two-component system, OmpR family, response regulator
VVKVCKVLIVEDNADIQQLLGNVFSYEGYEFAIAGDGRVMRHILAAENIDVVIVDVALPGGETGFTLAKHALDQGCGVILVTGHGQYFEAVEKSGHRYLLKPFRMRSLLELVDEVLKEVRARCVVKKRAYGA